MPRSKPLGKRNCAWLHTMTESRNSVLTMAAMSEGGLQSDAVVGSDWRSFRLVCNREEPLSRSCA